MLKVGVVNSGVCNLFSLENLLSYLDVTFISSSDPNQLIDCSHLILPGVGTFDSGMLNLKKSGLDIFLKTQVGKEIPLLGICLGMQLLFSDSEEGNEKGLGIVPGKIKRFPKEIKKVPHIGWNEVNYGHSQVDMFEGIENKTCFYFIHSYYADLLGNEINHYQTSHENFSFTSVIQCERIFATQFHPEKSQGAGLSLMKNFFKVKS